MSSITKQPSTTVPAADDELQYALHRPSRRDGFSGSLQVLLQESPEDDLEEFLQTMLPESAEIDQEEQRTNDSQIIILPLREWINRWGLKSIHEDQCSRTKLHHATLVRNVSVAYAIAKLLRYFSLCVSCSQYSFGELEDKICSLDNFMIRESKDKALDMGWEVVGMDMISPQINLILITNVFSCSNFFAETFDDFTGRNVDVSIMSRQVSGEAEVNANGQVNDDSRLCYLCGVLLHYLFSGDESSGKEPYRLHKDDCSYPDMTDRVMQKSTKKKCSASFPSLQYDDFPQTTSLPESACSKPNAPRLDMKRGKFRPLLDLGCPPSLSQLVSNLLDCGLGCFATDDAYPSLQAAIDDLHLLLKDPARFLFEEFNPAATISFQKDQLYGRSTEEQKIKEVLCRVASTGKNEAIFIDGFSGCGKTRLVQSVFEAVHAIGGYLVLTPKFDELQNRSPLASLMSAFNELCTLVMQLNSPEDLAELSQKLINSFGASSYLLARVIPNVADLIPSNLINQPSDNQVNFSALCLIVQRFVRVISSFSRPIVLVIDDLQWADRTTLSIVLAMLSDVKGSNLLVIGSYRDNEIKQGHALVEFFDLMTSFSVPTCIMHLDGIAMDDLNAMLADTLRIFPRLCQPLSSLVYYKTRGNPFFASEFLTSLIDRNIVSYSLRDKRWSWDVNRIRSEDITDNVLFLLTSKITCLTEDVQTALKIASCFGNEIGHGIVRELSVTSKYRYLKTMLDEAVTKNFLEFDGTNYRFVHSKVREVAYGLIGLGDKERYHFEIGMALQSRIVGDDPDDDVVFAAMDHIIHGGPLLMCSESQISSTLELSLEAGIKLMTSYNYTSAHSYLKTAVSLLPVNCWSAHYDLSLTCHFQLAKAAYPCGFIDEAKAMLLKIIDHGVCLVDKLDAYSLLVTVHHLAYKDISKAFCTSIEVLKLLGENLPERDVDKLELGTKMTKCKAMFEALSEDDFLHRSRSTCWKSVAVMRFYSQLSSVAYFVDPALNLFFVTKWALYCVEQKVICKHTPGAFVSFAAALCRNNVATDIRIGCKVGKIGMDMLHENDSAIDELPTVHLCYYMFTGIFTEPIQSCADMHLRASELAMNLGNNLMASLNISIMLHRALYGGKNLETLKMEIESHTVLAKQHSLQQLEHNLKVYSEVVLSLIGSYPSGSPMANHLSDLDVPEYEEISFMYQMFSSLFLGHMERVNYMAKKWRTYEKQLKMKEPVRFIYTTFISGLASASWYRKATNKQGLEDNVKTSLSILTGAAEFSKWNFQNKVHLLRAMDLSNKDKNSEASNEFNAAITAAHASKFNHEKGLACELAGIHHKRLGNNEEALRFFCLAQGCYKAWGSQVKVRQMIRQIEFAR